MESKSFYQLMLVTSLIALLTVYAAEHILHILPCSLCVYQRFGYMLLLYLCLVAINDENPTLHFHYQVFLLGVIFANIALSALHVAVENGLIEAAGSGLCKPSLYIIKTTATNDFKAALALKQYPSCNEVLFKALGLSITQWNLLINISLFVLASLRLMRTRESGFCASSG